MIQPLMSVVTGTKNRPASFDRFLRSAVAAATVPTEIIVSDASDEWTYTRDLMERCKSNPLIVSAYSYHEFPRAGVNMGYHLLCQKGTAKYVTFFNDDAELIPGWDRIAVNFMDEHPDVGIGCLYWRDPHQRWYVQSYARMIYPNFACIRKTAGDKFGWFETRSVVMPDTRREERITMYGMDTALAFKCIDAGFGCVPIPGCKVHHHREQDDVRQQNNREQGLGTPRGSTAGQVIWQLWNGVPEMQAMYGHEYGFNQLREKYEKFRHLLPKSEYLEE